MLIKLALPITLQNLITFAVTFADGLMVGTLGENVISGVHMGNQIQTLLQFFVGGFEQGMLILAAQYWGRKDTESIKCVFATAFRICVGAGLVITLAVLLFPETIIGLFTSDPGVVAEAVKYVRIVCFSYVFFCTTQMLISAMRSVEQAKVGMYISLVALVVNVSLNYIFIFGKLGIAPMGIRGAALATLISRIIETTVALCYVLFVDKKLNLRPSVLLRFNAILRRDLFKYGTPVLLGQIVWAVNMLSASAIIGHMDAAAITAVSITAQLNNMLFMGIMGLGAGLGILTGKTVGAGQEEKMKEYAYTAQILFALLGVITGIVIFSLRGWFSGLYNITEETRAVTLQFMLVNAVSSVGRAYQATCLSGLVKAGGDVGFVFRNDTLFVFLVVLPSAIIAKDVFHAPAWVVYACLMCDQILKCFVAVVKINRFNWMKNLTRDNPAGMQKEKEA